MKNSLFASLFVLALVLVVSPCAMAETPEQAEPNISTAPTAPAGAFLTGELATHGLKAFVDPETGEFRQPTAREAAALRQLAFQRFEIQTAAPVEHQMADGTVYALIDPSLHDAVTATRTEDGRVHVQCEADHAHDVPVSLQAPVREER